jgi:hypothetical protein
MYLSLPQQFKVGGMCNDRSVIAHTELVLAIPGDHPKKHSKNPHEQCKRKCVDLFSQLNRSVSRACSVGYPLTAPEVLMPAAPQL